MDNKIKDALSGVDIAVSDTLEIEPLSLSDLPDYSVDLNTINTINIDDIIKGVNGTFNVTATANSNYNMNGPSGSYYYTNTGPYITTAPNTSGWGTITTGGNGTGLHVTSDAEFEGDIKIKGKSILKTLEAIEKRLSILQPNPEKLEHFEALRKAYEHYKTLEALCEIPKKEEEK